MEKFNVKLFLESPKEIQQGIISFITDPDEINHLSSQSLEFKQLLHQSITHLNTEKDSYYLDINSLNDYPMLQEVSDNIIFKFTLGDKLNFKIPYRLKKFNFIISHVIDNKQLIIETLHYLFNQLNDDKREYKLNECTIRVMVNDKTGKYYSMAFVIDNQKICIFTQTLLHWFVPLKTFDIDAILIQLGIDYPHYNIGNSNFEFLRTSYYPTPLFKQFLQDISHEIKFELPGYFLTGYTRIDIESLITIYCTKVAQIYMYNFTHNLQRESLQRYKIYDYLITDYHNNVVETLKRKFLPCDGNILICHLYLTQPPIGELIEQDLNNLIRDLIDGSYLS